ncbi:MAG: hypothetical protein IJS15_10250, partial [Victivallales bacterium]|nr:hypothetical protein [Victivallales bacterium]
VSDIMDSALFVPSIGVQTIDLGIFSGKGVEYNNLNVLSENYYSLTFADHEIGEARLVLSPYGEGSLSLSLYDSDMNLLLSSDSNSLSLTGLDNPSSPTDYILQISSDREMSFGLSFDADWETGMDRFDYAIAKKNERFINGNGTIEKATSLGNGSYSGLVSYNGDKDYYLIMDETNDTINVVVAGNGVNVSEFDASGNLLQTATYADGQYSLTMSSMNYLCVEGDADLSQGNVNPYSISVSGQARSVGSIGLVINSVAGGEDSFDMVATGSDSIVLFDSSNTVYNYTDGLTATHSMNVIGNGTEATTLAGGDLYLAGNATTFRDLTLSGQVFGGDAVSGGVVVTGDASLSFNSVDFTSGKRIYGGSDVSGSGVAIIGDVTLAMDDVTGNEARVFGLGRVSGNGKLIAGDLDASISSADGGTFSNYFAGADVAAGYTGTIVCGEVSTVIDGGTFTYCGNGSQLRGGGSIQKDSTLTVNGGTFKHFVYAGAFSAGGTASVDGDTTLIINGGTFVKHVFGGCGALGTTDGDQSSSKTLVSGNASVIVNAVSNTIVFNANLYAGSRGYGNIGGGTSMTFTGLGSNLTFATNSYVTGNSQMFRGSVQYVGGEQLLAFDGFTGDFGANVNNGFSRLAVIDSNVSFTGSQVTLSGISKWELEVASADAELTLDHGKNSFKGDTLTITLADGAAPDADGWDVIAGTSDTLSGWNRFSAVSLGGESATFANGEWGSVNYRLFKEGNALRLATIA